MPNGFTVAEARTELDRLRSTLIEIVDVRADTVDLDLALQRGDSSPLGGLPELKARRARLDELVGELTGTADLQVKGIAPLLLDFPAELDGESVLLCWLEGDDELTWYHRLDAGFAGRRRLPT